MARAHRIGSTEFAAGLAWVCALSDVYSPRRSRELRPMRSYTFRMSWRSFCTSSSISAQTAPLVARCEGKTRLAGVGAGCQSGKTRMSLPLASERMLLRVERGKGGQYRNAMLPVGLLALLRASWKAGRQQGNSPRRLTVPRPALSQAARHPPTRPHRRRGGSRGGHRQAHRPARPCGTVSRPT